MAKVTEITLRRILVIEANSTSSFWCISPKHRENCVNLRNDREDGRKKVIWLIKEKAIEAQDKELYEFAVRCLLLFIFPSLVSFTSACIIGIPLNSILIILPFVCAEV